jgi:hypothetical protein
MLQSYSLCEHMPLDDGHDGYLSELRWSMVSLIHDQSQALDSLE